MDFFELRIGRFAQRRFAWYEVGLDAEYSDESPACPTCGAAVGGLYWLPPHEVTLKQPQIVGDFVSGAGGPDFLVSERFLNLYQQSALVGINEFFPVEVVRGRTRSNRGNMQGPLYGVYITHSPTRVDYNRMGVVWSEDPDPDYCRTCGPGGGGVGGILKSWQRIVVDQPTHTGDDFFYAMNFSGSILLTRQAAEFIIEHGFTNALMRPCSEASYSFGA